ncbi:uncharacterized protein METZ01_LOCUS310246 [marine metagenome]|uniref:Nif11 domain-containing protein n=1 Tax=marine metagenome TaxID=408172 RepID=A0A382NCE4_9ZZZZ
MSQQALEQFVTQIADSEELRTHIEGQLDSDGEMSMDELIELGAAYGCDFGVDDLNEAVELSDEELDGVAGGIAQGQYEANKAGSRVKLSVLSNINKTGINGNSDGDAFWINIKKGIAGD